jgi:hypothetical protein
MAMGPKMTFLRCIASGLQARFGLHHSAGLQEIYTFCGLPTASLAGIVPADKRHPHRHRHRHGHVIAVAATDPSALFDFLSACLSSYCPLSSNTCKMNLQGGERAVRRCCSEKLRRSLFSNSDLCPAALLSHPLCRRRQLLLLPSFVS